MRMSIYTELLGSNQVVKPKKKRGRRKKNPELEEEVSRIDVFFVIISFVDAPKMFSNML